MKKKVYFILICVGIFVFLCFNKGLIDRSFAWWENVDCWLKYRCVADSGGCYEQKNLCCKWCWRDQDGTHYDNCYSECGSWITTGSCPLCDCYAFLYDCRGCTPAGCPSGQSYTVSGALCKKDRTSCTGEDGCGPCTLYSPYCYLPETNVVPPVPDNMQICYYEGSTNPEFPTWNNGDDAECDTISTNPNNPTVVRENYADYNRIFIRTPIVDEPAGSNTQGVRYQLGVGGLVSGWQVLPYIKVINVDESSPSEDFGAEQVDSVDTGDGSDGAIVVSSNTNINTTNLSGSCVDGDAANYNVTGLSSNSAVLSTSPGVGCLDSGDEVILINVGGTQTSVTNVGQYEVFEVQSKSGTQITFTSNKTKWYGDGVSNDSNLGTTISNQKVMLQRIPQYTDVTVNINRTFFPTPYNGVKGGVMYFKVNGTVTVNGSINATGSGYYGGLRSHWRGARARAGWGAFFAGTYDGSGGYYHYDSYGNDGVYSGGGGGSHKIYRHPNTGVIKYIASPAGSGSTISGATGGGGGASQPKNSIGGAGGGGGHVTPGMGGEGYYNAGDGSYGSSGAGSKGRPLSYSEGGGGGGGRSFGVDDYSKLIMGGGGGGGGAGETPPPPSSGIDYVSGGSGGGGGGIVMISANDLRINGTVNADGVNGGDPTRNKTGALHPYGGGGGGGGGGTIFIETNVIYIGGTGVSANGGIGGKYGINDGGNGGVGVSNINYTTLLVDNRKQWTDLEYDWGGSYNPEYLSELIDGFNKTTAAAGGYSFLNEFDINPQPGDIDVNIPQFKTGLESEAVVEITFQSATIDRCDYDKQPGAVLSGYLSLLGDPPIPTPIIDPIEEGEIIVNPSSYETWVGSTSNPEFEEEKISNNPKVFSARVTHELGIEKVDEIRFDIAETGDIVDEEDLRIVLSINGSTMNLGYVIGESGDIQNEIELEEDNGTHYLREDITKGEDFDFKINKDDTYIETTATEITVHLSISILGDKDLDTQVNSNWEGSHNILWSAMDDDGVYDFTGDSVDRSDGITYQDAGTVHVDFTPPYVVHDFSLSECGELDVDQSCWHMNISELETYDSGLFYLDGVKYKVWPDEGTVTLDDIPLHENVGDPWLTEYETSILITKDSEDEAVGVWVDSIIDRVGNVLSVDDYGITWEPERLSWVRTTGDGDVYGALGYENNILEEFPLGTGMHLAKYWVGGGGTQQAFDFSPGTGSLRRWISAQYDNSNAYSWYTQLRRMAVSSDCAEDEEDECVFEAGTSVTDILASGEGIYMINLSDAEDQKEEIIAGSECSGGNKAIFISNGTLEISPNFTSIDESRCFFISDGDITILPGDTAGGTLDRSVSPAVVVTDVFDQVDAAFVVDGVFSVEDDNEERLEINGSIFAGDTDFKRVLSVGANRVLPAELINYIPLQFLFEDMLSQRLFHQFECGIYDNLPSCSGWE